MALVTTGDSDATHRSLECLGTVPTAAGSRLQFSWSTGTQVRLCEVFSPATSSGGQEPYMALHNWNPLVNEQRRVAYDVVPFYRKLRQTLHQLGPERHQEAKAALQEYSGSVLGVLKVNSSDPSLGPPADEEALHVAYEAGLWQLLDLLFLRDDTQEGFFAEAFSAWLAEHGGLLCSTPGYHVLAAEARRLSELPRVDSEPSYWPTVQRLVLLGQLELAVKLLMAHPAYAALQDPDMATKVECIEVVYQLLRVVPRFSRAGGSSSGRLGTMGTSTDDVVQFSSERAVWMARVDELWRDREQLFADIKRLDPAASKGLAGILCLLCAGSDNSSSALTSFKFASSIAANWVELLAGTLLWKYPTLQPQLHLRQLIAKIQAAPGLEAQQSDESFLEFLQDLLLASCDQEVQSVISLCINAPYCSLQFVAHIYDVLRGNPNAERVIRRQLPHYGVDQAELYTLHYAETLLGHVATWLVAAEYLAWCPVNGAALMESVLDRSPFPSQDDRTALKALALAQRHGLTAAAAGLARKFGRAAAQQGRTAAALQWMMRAHDPAACAELVAPLLATVQRQLLSQVGDYQAAPLAIPELDDLGPLLARLPEQHSSLDSVALSHQHLGQQVQGIHSKPYKELHFLQAFCHLQAALVQVHKRQQQNVQEPKEVATAYAAVRQPVVELLLEGLAPSVLQLPLLLYILPVVESVHMPFSRADVQGLLQLCSHAAGDLTAASAANLAGTDGAVLGLPVFSSTSVDAAAETANGVKQVHTRHINDVRLALCRSLAKAHVLESSLQVMVS